jgi:tyrosyl-tRNA synthetase
MGKSVSGAVWLSADKLSTYDYWQFWRNTEDADVFKFMRLFTDIDLAEIAKLEADVKNSSLNINDAKKILANEATIICHGADAARDAEETARKVFEQGGVGDDLPTIEISKAELESGIKITKILQDAGLAESGGAAKRLIEGGGVKVNDVKVGDVSQSINHADLNAEGIIKISASKKKHALVKVDLL